MGRFNILRHDPPAEKIKNQDEIKKASRYWRLRVFYSIYIGYALFYFTRKSFAYIMPELEKIGYGKMELGFILSLGSIAYAVSKFLIGFVSDKANVRLLMSVGLILTGICNIFCGFSSSILFFALFMGLNGLFQGSGAPPCAKLLTCWFSQKERGRWWGLWNTSHNLGGAVIPLLCAFAAGSFGWQYGFYFPGIFAIFIGLFLMNRIRDRPLTVGLPPIEKIQRNHERSGEIESEEEDLEEGEKTLSSRQILFEHVLKNKFIWLLGCAFFFVYIIRQIITDWAIFFMMESKEYGYVAASSGVFWFEIGGAVGALAAGWLSDVVFDGKRGPVNLMFSLGILLGLFAIWSIPSGSIWLLSSSMFLVGFFVFGPQMLIGMTAAELAHKEAAGTATGFVGFFAYVGGIMAGGPCGKIIDDFGYVGLFRMLIACSLISIVLILPVLGKKLRPRAVETGPAS